MLWCLIFHSAELQNYVPALHGIMFGSFNFNKKCNKLCSALLELCWEYFTYNQAGSFFEFSPILFGSSELRSERGFSNYVRQVDWQPRDKKLTRSLEERNISRTLLIYSNYYQCSCTVPSNMADNKRGRGDRDENQENPNECKSAKAIKLSTFFFSNF